MRSFFVFLFLVLCFPVTAPVSFADEAVAQPPQWREQEMDAASFASDWLTDLDNGDFAEAVDAYMPLGATPGNVAIRERLRDLRAACGNLSSRTFISSSVFAVATDDSEHRIRVIYHTEFKNKTVREVVEILLFTNNPSKVTEYRLEPAV